MKTLNKNWFERNILKISSQIYVCIFVVYCTVNEKRDSCEVELVTRQSTAVCPGYIHVLKLRKTYKCIRYTP